MNSIGIYIHVPFCGKKCGYCDFYSLPYTKNSADAYVNAVIRNIRHYSDKNRTADTIYFGGGTPSLLSPEQISMIIGEIRDCFILDENAEVTLEANPCTLSPSRLSALRKTGINRLSIGVQSLIDSELEYLGRSHTPERAIKSVKDAYDSGFENISCDIMIGIPYQTAESLEYSVNGIAALPVNHVSAYILKTESGTPFDCEEVRNLLPDDDKAADMYLQTVHILKKHGFEQYEVSNFARKGYESRHNCRYWKCYDYIGIGASAHSCYMKKRFAVPNDIQLFINSDVQPTIITDESPCGFEEYAMLRLRLSEGLNLSETGIHRTSIEKKIPELIKSGYVNYDGENVSLTEKGFLMSNSVIEYLIFE
jgi:oxygen-independent coproporphyrinogen-3 oxidase